jgi:hypothetical protein
MFNTIQQWWSRMAREERVPPYIILITRQLLLIIA